MRPNASKGVWICPKCNTTVKMGNAKIVEHEQAAGKDVAVVEQKVATLPTTQEECPKCGHNEAYWVLRQTRGADEPETRILQCTKCGHKWREYQ